MTRTHLVTLLWQATGDFLTLLSTYAESFALYCYGEIDHPIKSIKDRKKLDAILTHFEKDNKL